MSVAATLARNNASFDSSTFQEFCTATLSGTYVQGGFTFNPFTVAGGKGSSPLPSSSFLRAIWTSPLGYIYYTSVSGNVATTLIFSAPGTELAAGALPETVIPVILIKRKL